MASIFTCFLVLWRCLHERLENVTVQKIFFLTKKKAYYRNSSVNTKTIIVSLLHFRIWTQQNKSSGYQKSILFHTLIHNRHTGLWVVSNEPYINLFLNDLVYIYISYSWKRMVDVPSVRSLFMCDIFLQIQVIAMFDKEKREIDKHKIF